MEKAITATFIFLLFVGLNFSIENLNAQNNLPCCTAPNIPTGCSEAGTSQLNSCIICGLAGIYQGNNGGYPALGGFSCGVPHNSAWVSVIANAAGSIDATILATNCVTGEGLQLILFDFAGNEISCYSVPGSVIPATVSAAGLTPGAIYSFQIDGFSGDVCDFTVIVNGAVTGQIPDPIVEIRSDRDSVVCQGTIVCYEINRPGNTDSLLWEVPNNLRIISGGGFDDDMVCCIAESEGSGVIGVTPANFCFKGFQSIYPIEVLPGITSSWAPIEICDNGLPFDTMICDSLFTFSDYGNHQIVCKSGLDCDSIINFSLIPAHQVPQAIDTVICMASGILQLPSISGFASTFSGAGVIPNGIFDPEAAGVGSHTLTSAFSQQTCSYNINHQIEVIESPIMNVVVDSPIFSLSGTGKVTVTPPSGAAPYRYLWSNGDTTQSLTNLSSGEYCLTITNPNGCAIDECYEISESYSVAPVQVICPGEFADLSVSPLSGATFNWSPVFGLSCSDCPNPVANPRRTTIYTITVTLPNGRSASQNVLIIVLPSGICNLKPNDEGEDYAALLSDIDFEHIAEKDLVEIEQRIINFSLEKEVAIAPNPTDGMVNILTPANVKSVEVYDLAGKQILWTLEREVNLSSFAKGVYFFKIKVEDQVIVKRVVLL